MAPPILDPIPPVPDPTAPGEPIEPDPGDPVPDDILGLDNAADVFGIEKTTNHPADEVKGIRHRLEEMDDDRNL